MIIAISAICTVINAVVHILWAPVYEYYPPSFFIKNNLFQVAAPISLFITYALLGIVFAYIQNNLPGKKIEKGLRYGISFGGLWFLGILGMSLIFNSPIETELAVGGVDCFTLVLLGLLLGKFMASDNKCNAIEKDREGIGPIFTIGLMYVIGRYLAYVIFDFDIGVAYTTRLLDTLLWTSGIGLWMGLAYSLLKQSLNNYSPAKKAILFGGIILGIDWVLFNLFALLLVDESPIELLLMAGSDILLVIAGVLFFETFIKKDTNKNVAGE